jgi:DNA end-binding protein Ku
MVMSPRAIWKASIRFGAVSVPVRLYSAVQDRTVHFRLLHGTDLMPVKQRMVHPGTGRPIPSDQIRRGYETEAGEFVILEDEELAGLEPASSRDIVVTRFVDPGAIGHQWYDRPYLLGPDGDPESFSALALALRRSARQGVVQWTMRKREYVGALLERDGNLMLITMFHTGEVVDPAGLPRPEGRPLEKQELLMAEQLIALLEGEFDHAAYYDEYRRQVLALIEAKDTGTPVPFRRIEERPPEAVSLKELLSRSVARAKEEREVA